MLNPRMLAVVARTVPRHLPANRRFSRLSTRHTFLRNTYRFMSTFSQRSYALSTEGTNVENLVDKLSDSQYNQIANEYLEILSDNMEELSEVCPQVDVELTHGVVTLSVADGKTYVINKQPPNKQIWLSSPYSGPKRYDLIGGKWITLRDNSGLTNLLQKELEEELGQEVLLTMEQ